MIAKRVGSSRWIWTVTTAALLWACGDGARAQDSSPGSDPEAVELVDDWIDALGGMEQHENLRTARFTMTTEMYDAASGRLRRARPRYVAIARLAAGLAARIERWEGDDFIVQGFDGQTDWAYTNGEPLTPADKDQEEVLYVSGDVNYWIGLPFKLKDGGVHLHYDGTDAAGRHTVRVTFDEGIGDHQDVWHYYFVDGRTWPVQVDYQEAGKDNVNHTRWEDIRSADGYFYVGARVHFNDDGRVTKIIRTHDVEINPELEETVFAGLSPSGG